MSCDVGEVMESLENEQSSFSKLSVTSPMSQLILQPFPRFTYVIAHSPTLALLHLHHSSFSNPSFAYPTSQDFHLRHPASRPWGQQQTHVNYTEFIKTVILLSTNVHDSLIVYHHAKFIFYVNFETNFSILQLSPDYRIYLQNFRTLISESLF